MQPQALTNARTIDEWAEDISADLNQGAECLIRAGHKLIASKGQLPHGSFLKLVERLKVGADTAQRLMAIARSPVLSNAANTRHLPRTFSALQEILRLGDEKIVDAIDKGLVTPDLKVKAARAIAGAYNKPEGEVIGGAQHMLPSPKEAREIARATGRFVAASDNNIYSGATEEEGRAYRDKRNAAFAILEAIQLLSEAPEPRAWLRNSERHWFVDFRPGSIDDAREWLADLKQAMEIVDA